MAKRRQGECPGCPHDIIDSRDLKYYRNGCGHWFRPEDDRFARASRLPLARHGYIELLVFGGLFLFLALSLAHFAWWNDWWALWLPATACLGLAGFVVAFFRDPERPIPTGADLLLSPADGTVTHVGEVDEPDFPGGRAFRVSIFLSVFNVHVNRVPRSGRVMGLRYYRGGFLDARHPHCSTVNEQLWTDLDDERGIRVRVKQIAGLIARRIVCWLREGEEVRAGDRFGMIKFGSRTDLLVPPEAVAEVMVKVGDKVRGGAMGLLRLR
jgi:phosphatidylserine decarboxylase